MLKTILDEYNKHKIEWDTVRKILWLNQFDGIDVEVNPSNLRYSASEKYGYCTFDLFVDSVNVNKGHATYLLSQLITIIKSKYPTIHRIQSTVVNDPALERVLIKNGFVLEGMSRYCKNAEGKLEDRKNFAYYPQNNLDADLATSIKHRHREFYTAEVYSIIKNAKRMNNSEEIHSELEKIKTIVTDGTKDNILGKEVFEDISKEFNLIDESRSESYSMDFYNKKPVRISELIRELDRCDPNGSVYLTVGGMHDKTSYSYTKPLQSITPCIVTGATFGGVDINMLSDNSENVSNFSSVILN